MSWFLRKKRGKYTTTLNTVGRATVSRGWTIFGRQRITASGSIGNGGNNTKSMTTLRFGSWQHRSRGKGFTGMNFIGAAIVGFFDNLFFKPKPKKQPRPVVEPEDVVLPVIVPFVAPVPKVTKRRQPHEDLMLDEEISWKQEQARNRILTEERSQIYG